ncbi:MAG TPA: penicillin-binding protein 2 [Candidatus Baltobacteraceae bacterium]|nr:penicillin-binding protein 2 [Candidatus Baltobacteraceae bacterium]
MHKRTFARVGPRRAKILFYALLTIGVFLCWRLVNVQLIKGPLYAKEALDQRSDTVEVYARRGSILDRDGNILVHSLPSESVYAVPHDLGDADQTIAALTRILGRVSVPAQKLMHDRNMQFVWLARKITHDVADKVQALNLPGVSVIEEDTGRRIDISGQSASTVLGFVGIDENGLSGIEYSYDDLLKGTSGKNTLEADEFGRPLPFGRTQVLKPAKPGLTLELTLDSYLQYAAEAALRKQVTAFHAKNGTAIVMDPQTGEVLAMANFPHYDPNQYWKFPADSYRDRAVTDLYEPGSTFKLVTAAAAVESGLVSNSDRFNSIGPLEVGGRQINNALDGLTPSSAGDTLDTIIADSLNVGIARVAMAIGGRRFFDMEQKLGFAEPTNIGLAGESPGLVPEPASWSGSSLATMSFGQGVSVTPIAMTRFYCAIANGGMLLRPRIVKAIQDDKGRTVYEYPTQIEHRAFSEHTAQVLRSYLRSVVVRGTGNPAAKIAGYTTAGKTGTAQAVINGRYDGYVASFIGMVPYEHPRYVIYVKVEQPQDAIYGSVVAAPAFDEIAKAAMLHAGVLPSVLPSPNPAHAPRLVSPRSVAKTR